MLASAVHFDSTVLPIDRQFSAWADAVVNYRVGRPDEAPSAPFRAQVSGFPIGEAVLVEAVLGDSLTFSGPDLPGQPHNLSIVFLMDGNLAGKTGGREFLIGSGQAMIFDWRLPADVTLSPSRSLVLIVPERLLAGEMGVLPYLHGCILNGTGGRLLTGYVQMLVGQVRDAPAADLPALGKATTMLAASCLSGMGTVSGDDPRAGSAIRLLAERYIEAHLRNRGLSPMTIQQELGVARTTLYRAFAQHGGIGRYIQQRRLEAAHAALGAADNLRSIKSIAFDHCFSSVPHFNAAFRRRFGYRPLDARLGALPTLCADLDLLHAPPERRLHALVSGLGH